MITLDIKDTLKNSSTIHKLPEFLIPLEDSFKLVKAGLKPEYKWQDEFKKKSNISSFRKRYTKGEENEEKVIAILERIKRNNTTKFKNVAVFQMNRKTIPDKDLGIDIIVIFPNYGGMAFQVKSSESGALRFQEKKHILIEYITILNVNYFNRNYLQRDLEKLLNNFHFWIHEKKLNNPIEI